MSVRYPMMQDFRSNLWRGGRADLQALALAAYFAQHGAPYELCRPTNSSYCAFD
jgi:hypothetical protein